MNKSSSITHTTSDRKYHLNALKNQTMILCVAATLLLLIRLLGLIAAIVLSSTQATASTEKEPLPTIADNVIVEWKVEVGRENESPPPLRRRAGRNYHIKSSGTTKSAYGSSSAGRDSSAVLFSIMLSSSRMKILSATTPGMTA